LKQDPNDEWRFLIENPAHSDFFFGRVLIHWVASSCWLEGKAKTPAGKAEEVRPRRKRSLARKSPAVQQTIYTSLCI